MRNSTANSMVLIDEFGKGTLTCDGIGLFCATIEYFCGFGKECPRLIACTHFHEILQDKILDSRNVVAYKTMKIITCPSDDPVAFLYKVVDGFSTNSWGFNCATMAGISQAIVDRAMVVADLLSKGKPVQEESAQVDENVERISDLFLSIDMDQGGLDLLWQAL